MERMEKQTAVEWLAKNLKDFSHIKHSFSFKELIKQAKAMEKEQIIDFADKYGTYLLKGGTMSAATYNETFKSE